MITMPMSTPTAINPAITRKSEPPLAAGAPDALAAADGLATATADRVGDGRAVAVGAAVVGVAVVGAGLRDAVALAAIVGTTVVAAVGDGVAAVVVVGDGDVVLVPSDAQARESLTPGADAHTDRAGVTHELPSAPSSCRAVVRVLPYQVQRRGVSIERRARPGAEAASSDVIAARVQGEDVLVEAHEHVRRRREHIRLAEARSEAVVRRLRLEHPHHGALAQLGQVATQLKLRRDGCRRTGRCGEQRESDHEEPEKREEPAHRGRL